MQEEQGHHQHGHGHHPHGHGACGHGMHGMHGMHMRMHRRGGKMLALGSLIAIAAGTVVSLAMFARLIRDVETDMLLRALDKLKGCLTRDEQERLTQRVRENLS